MLHSWGQIDCRVRDGLAAAVLERCSLMCSYEDRVGGQGGRGGGQGCQAPTARDCLHDSPRSLTKARMRGFKAFLEPTTQVGTMSIQFV